MKALEMIQGTFGSLSKEGFHIPYNHVRQHLEYCAQVWSPYKKDRPSCLEKVRATARPSRRATKLVRNLEGGQQLIKQLGLVW